MILRFLLTSLLGFGVLLGLVSPAQAHSVTQGYLYSHSEFRIAVIYSTGEWEGLDPGHNTFEMYRWTAGKAIPVTIKLYPGQCLKYRVENSTHTGFGSWKYQPVTDSTFSFVQGRDHDLYAYGCSG